MRVLFKSEVIDVGAAKNLWANFESFTSLTEVIRMGFVVCGMYDLRRYTPSLDGATADFDDEPGDDEIEARGLKFRNKADSAKADKTTLYETDSGLIVNFSEMQRETVAEHSARVANLLSEIMVWYPLYFEGVDKFLALKVALNHDIGEAAVGDQLDDGTQPHADKELPEWEAAQEFYEHLPKDIARQAMDYHRQFDDCSTLLGQMIKMADKLDAVGRLILFEKHGMRGNVYRKHPPSEQDVRFAKEVGTGNCTDVWARHLQYTFQTRNFTANVVKIARDFLTEGLNSAGREFFTWW